MTIFFCLETFVLCPSGSITILRWVSSFRNTWKLHVHVTKWMAFEVKGTRNSTPAVDAAAEVKINTYLRIFFCCKFLRYNISCFEVIWTFPEDYIALFLCLYFVSCFTRCFQGFLVVDKLTNKLFTTILYRNTTKITFILHTIVGLIVLFINDYVLCPVLPHFIFPVDLIFYIEKSGIGRWLPSLSERH